MYLTIKYLHIATALISISGFALRGIGMWLDADWMRQRWVRVVPHINDSVLLLSALALVTMSGLYPWQQPWLAAKLVALLVYIGLGMAAFRFARSPVHKRLFWLAALLTALYILGTALSRRPDWPAAQFAAFM